MEKLVYVLWKSPEESAADFGRRMQAEIAPELERAGVRGLSMNLADEASAYAQGIRITRMKNPVAATVSIWVDTHLKRAPLEDLLVSAAERTAGFLVLESVPLPYHPGDAVSGSRVPGITTVGFLGKPEGLSYDAWRMQWQEHHTRVAIETQSTFLYVQNVVIRPVTPDAPAWDAIVEECFPAEAATDPMVFYNAGDSKEKLEENQRRMLESCRKFLDIEQVESHPMSMYIVHPWGSIG